MSIALILAVVARFALALSLFFRGGNQKQPR